jgi:hypothetical protein
LGLGGHCLPERKPHHVGNVPFLRL